VADRGSVAKVFVAKIGAAHGIRGEVKLWSFTADPMAIKDYGPLENEDGTARFEIEALRAAKDHFVARFAGIDDRNAAERLTNLRLFVPRARLLATGEDEFYHADLIGLKAVGAQGQEFGTVVAVQNFGAGDLLEIKIPNGSETVLMPFTVTTVPAVDVVGGRIVIDPPQGLFE
jgi:16S rRNA processing protein RimM